MAVVMVMREAFEQQGRSTGGLCLMSAFCYNRSEGKKLVGEIGGVSVIVAP